MLSCWLEFNWRDEICFRLASVAANNWVVLWRWLEACSALMPGASWTTGSAVPPFRTTFFSGVALDAPAALFRCRRRFLAEVLVFDSEFLDSEFFDSAFFSAASGDAFCGSGVAAGAGGAGSV
jgi:hypothetical protein